MSFYFISSSSSFVCLSYSTFFFFLPFFFINKFSTSSFVPPPFPSPPIYPITSLPLLLYSSISSFSTSFFPSFRVSLRRSAAPCFKQFLLHVFDAPAVRWLVRLCGAPASSTCASCYLPCVHSLGQTSLIKT